PPAPATPVSAPASAGSEPATPDRAPALAGPDPAPAGSESVTPDPGPPAPRRTPLAALGLLLSRKTEVD
ncbi:hypothetical protein ADL04_05725, partial [Streptomyces sp. NRRL B-3648]